MMIEYPRISSLSRKCIMKLVMQAIVENIPSVLTITSPKYSSLNSLG